MDNEVNWEALARYVAGECSEAEEEEILAWAEADPMHREILETTRQAWRVSGDASVQWDSQSAWTRVRERIDAGPAKLRRDEGHPRRTRAHWAARSSRGPRQWAVAASVVVVAAASMVGVAFWAGGRRGNQPVAVQELVTRKGQRAQMRLADGTQVVIGPDSRLVISARFGEPTREVDLTGEAYFDVADDPTRPFVVTSGVTVTQVLGTEFNVRAYPADSTVQVVVSEGRVSFRPRTRDADHAAVLRPGDLAELQRGSEEVARRRVDPDAYLGWREGRLTFEDAPLSQVAAQLERWYGVPVRIGDASLLSRRLTASFRDQPVDEVMAVIATSLGLEYTRVGQIYTFLPRGRVSALARS